jgi:hypothetical protein
MESVLVGLGIWASIITSGVVAAMILLHQLVYRDYRLPGPFSIIIALFTRGRLGPPSNVDTILRALRRGLHGGYITGTDGRRRSVSTLTVRLSPEDIAEISRRGILDLQEQLERSYQRIVQQEGWESTGPLLFISIVRDDSLRPNFPQVDVGQTGSNLTPAWFSEPIPAADLSPTTRYAEGASSLPATDVTPAMSHADLSITATSQYRQQNHGPHVLLPSQEQEQAEDEWEKVGCLTADGHPVVYVFAVGTTIGRAKENDLVIDDKTVSRNHARIEIHDGEMVLVPIAGRFCWVNRILIKGQTIINWGDILQFADYPQEFVVEGLPGR